MASGSVVLRAKHKSTTKDPGTPGVLKLEEKFIFMPNNPQSASSKMNIDFQFIKAHKYTKDGSNKPPWLNLSLDQGGSHIFEFDNYSDLHVCREYLSQALTKAVEASKPAPEKETPSVTTRPEEQLSTAEMELRIKLLRENGELQRLHKQLVIGRVLTEAEFWANRKKLLDTDSRSKSKQRVGFNSVMISDIKPSTDGRTNRVKFNLNREIIFQIFAEKPAVHRAFLNLVPNKMTEMDFWTKYFRAGYLHSTKNTIAAAAEAAEDEELAIFLKQDDIVASEASKKIKQVHPTLDILATEADDYMHLPGHGILHDDSLHVTEQQDELYKRTLAQDLNRHASVVLEGRPIDVELDDARTLAEALAQSKQAYGKADTSKEKLNRIYPTTEIEDLQPPKDLPLAPLCIKDPRDYFDSQQASLLRTSRDTLGGTEPLKCSLSTQDAYGSLRDSISNFKSVGLSIPIVNSEVAAKVFNALTHNISSTKYHMGKNPGGSVLDMLPNSTKEELLHQSTCIQELLKHFWSSYPITTSYLFNKVSRLKDAMSQIYSQLEDMKKSVQSDLRHQALDAAIQHHDADLQKRSSRSVERPNGHT
ncbi:general transcription and DNA repair factor IIH subunit TFB1-1-like isoform X2 [Tripterygium wilfordii]|uniref:general transcription and DNA repair factor IIH subunit TFB1-1-like isoform X2 n=1 Tax=Tripterygium wilfordii TaxID=458696 RepID=UPI0018F7EDAE|nr:general transcription and DNA repair factor IIH subunit TFB1-1-like isoform X2 [Tripterygium wilfordii]